MKLATYKDGSRDGQLIVVSRDLRMAHYATGIASRLQQVLDDWGFLAPQLQDLYHLLNTGRARHAFAFDPMQCMAPLPRAFHWAEAQAYPSHAALTDPEQALARTEPQIRHGAGDSLAGPCDDIVVPSAALGIDMGAGWAAITGDLPMGCSAEEALHGVRLLMLSHTLTLRQLSATTAQVQRTPVTGFSPVAVTVDELGDAWKGGRVHLPLQTSFNGRKTGMCEAGEGMDFSMSQLLSHLCRTRSLQAGAIVGSGVVSNPGQLTGRGKERRTDWPRGAHCLAEKRLMENHLKDSASTPWMQFGDTVRSEMKGRDGQSIFGAMDHTIVSPQGDGSAD